MFRIVGVAALFLTALAVGFWRGVTFESKHRCEVKIGEEIEIVGAVLDVKRSSFNQKLTVSTEKEWPSAVYVYADPLPIINSGEKVGVSGKPVAVSWNSESARAAGVCFEIRKAEVKHLGNAQGVSAALSRIGVLLANKIGRVIPSPFAEVSSAMLFGRGEDLPNEFFEDARRSGLAHALVLSGYNISKTIAFVIFISFLLPRTFRIFFAVFVGWLLAGISGFGYSAIRAALGATIVGFVDWGFRKADALKTLIFVVFIIEINNPFSLAYSLSFQLSVLATLGIIAFSDKFSELPFIRLIPKSFGLREAASATLSAEFLISPLIVWKIGSIPILGLVANIFASPVVPLTMIFAVFALPLGILNFSPDILSWFLALPARWFVSVSSYVSDFPFALIFMSLNSYQAIFLIIIFMIFAFISINESRRIRREKDLELIKRLTIASSQNEPPQHSS